MIPRSRRIDIRILVPALAALCALVPPDVSAAESSKPAAVKAAAPKAASAKDVPAPRRSPMSMSMGTSGLAAYGVPEYQEPAAYSVDLVVTSPKSNMTMKRYIDNGRIRTDIAGVGQDISMIEMGDEKGTSLTLIPKEKKAIQQSREAMEAMSAGMTKQEQPDTDEKPAPPDAKVEDLGDETIDGRATRKLRFVVAEGAALGWFDKATGAPVRMESSAGGESTTLEWKNYAIAPQPAKLFEVPKGYEVIDMDEMMSKMKSMGGMKGMAGMAGMSGMPGMSGMAGMGGMGGGLNGMAGGFGQNMGQSMGSNLGGSLGGAFGGPIGAIAGQYIGGKVGGMVGRKAAEMVTPGK